jgi:hypothetical protein
MRVEIIVIIGILVNLMTLSVIAFFSERYFKNIIRDIEFSRQAIIELIDIVLTKQGQTLCNQNLINDQLLGTNKHEEMVSGWADPGPIKGRLGKVYNPYKDETKKLSGEYEDQFANESGV